MIIKKSLKDIYYHIIMTITVVLCLIIGAISNRTITAREANHPTMSGAISFIAWNIRGVYAALLIQGIYRQVLQSNISTNRKIATILMIVAFNLPLMYFIELGIFFPIAALIIIPVANLIAFLPVIKAPKPNA